MSVIELTGVDVDLGTRPVLRGVDLTVEAGETVAVVGPNGAGKTTLLRTILGLVPARAGTVRLAGRPPKALRGRIGYVPQRHDADWDLPLSVADLVRTGTRHGRTRGRRDADVAAALERVGLAPVAERPVAALSGGQRQRVLIARALVSAPVALLLDEPYTGVDEPTQRSLTALIDSLAAEGTAVVVTTHDLVAAVTASARLCVVHGAVVLDGPPAEVVADPALAAVFGPATAQSLRLLLPDTDTAPRPTPDTDKDPAAHATD